jgi:hypothetical protein
MAQWNKVNQDFLNQERSLFEVPMIATKDGEVVSETNRFPVGIGTTGFVAINQGGSPVTFNNPFPVSLGSSNITITGDVNVGTTVSVTSTPQDPVHTHITQIGSSGLLEDEGIPYMPIGIGTAQNLNLSYLPVGISTLLNTVSIGNTVSISNTSFYILNPVTTVTVGGTVSIANTVSISNTSFYITNPVTTVAVSGIGSTVTVQGTVGIGTTGQVSLNLNSAPVSSSNPLPVTGTVSISTTSSASVTLPSTSSDAFGRLRVSNPLTLFDSSHRYRDNNLWSSLVVGTGSTVGFVTTQGLINIGIGTTAGCSVIRETTKVFAYQPGKSLLVLNTFVMNPKKTNLRQRVGYFGADNGIYLELDGDTLYFVRRSLSFGTTTRVAQEDWTIDKLDGTGPSGVTLNSSKAEILWMDIEWLGVGSVRMGFVIDGAFIHCHTFHHANIIESTYITSGSLPLRYEIANTGITTSTSNLKQICSSVISEGGYNLHGLQQAVGTPITTPRTLTTAGTFYPIVSIRLKTSPNNLDAIAIITALSAMPIATGAYNWQIRASGTTGGGTWVSAGDDSSVNYNITGTSHTGGRILASGFFTASNQGSTQIDIPREALFKFQLERNGLTSTPYEISLVIASNGNGDTVVGSMDWEEVSR